MKKHIGSTVALVLGVLLFLSGLTQEGGNVITGIVVILGALAYRSSKKQKLGEVKRSNVRRALEIAALMILAALVFLQNDIVELIENDPVPNLLIPFWAFAAYFVVTIDI
jgi:multisubunit Na+/H+ antiporter MnhB subunit